VAKLAVKLIGLKVIRWGAIRANGVLGLNGAVGRNAPNWSRWGLSSMWGGVGQLPGSTTMTQEVDPHRPWRTAEREGGKEAVSARITSALLDESGDASKDYSHAQWQPRRALERQRQRPRPRPVAVQSYSGAQT
jgi:hypothetical protein